MIKKVETYVHINDLDPKLCGKECKHRVLVEELYECNLYGGILKYTLGNTAMACSHIRCKECIKAKGTFNV